MMIGWVSPLPPRRCASSTLRIVLSLGLLITSVAACAGSSSTRSSSGSEISDSGADGHDQPNWADASATDPQPTSDDSRVTSSGLAFHAAGITTGGPAWTKMPTSPSDPPNVLDVALTEWTDGCSGAVPDRGRFVWIVANGVSAGRTYSVVDTNIVGGDGSGQVTVLVGKAYVAQDTGRYACGFLTDLQTERGVRGTLTVERLDHDGVAGKLEVTLASGAVARVSFGRSYCMAPHPTGTLGCELQ